MNLINNYIITDISWERSYLNFNIKGNSKSKYYLFCYKTKKQIPIKYEKIVNDTLEFQINLTFINNNTFLENGKWRIIAKNNSDDENYFNCILNTEMCYKLEHLDKIFKYGKNNLFAYNVSFSLGKDRMNEYIWIINSYFTKKNNKWYRRRYRDEITGYKNFFNKITLDSKIFLINFAYLILNALFINKDKNILFVSETKEYIWGNLKVLDDKIKEKKLYENYNILYSFRTAIGVNHSSLSWLKLIIKISKSNTIFVDDYVPVFNFLKLNTKTNLIQLWHAGIGFKAVGYCRFGKSGSPFPVCSCHKNYTSAVVSSKKAAHIMGEVFGLNDSFFEILGMPRLDNFLDEDKIIATKKSIYTTYPNLENKKIILFAPTYRGTGQKNAYYDYKQLNYQKIYDICEEKDYLFLLKMHPFITKQDEIPIQYKNRIIELSEYKHINDLYYITDLLITDYSSNYYEYSLLKKPILFFTYDRENYEVTRGVHHSIKDVAPGKVCDTFDDLITAIKNDDFEFYKTTAFIENHFGEGLTNDSCDKIIDKFILNNKTK